MALKIAGSVRAKACFNGAPPEDVTIEIAYGGKHAAVSIYGGDEHVAVWIEGDALDSLAQHMVGAANGEGHEW